MVGGAPATSSTASATQHGSRLPFALQVAAVDGNREVPYVELAALKDFIADRFLYRRGPNE